MTKDEALKKAFKQAFQLGQDYWYQADHEYVSQNKKSDVTRAKFEQLMEDAIKEALAQPPLPVQPEQEPVARVAEVHMSRYTIEWTNGLLPEGTELFAAPTPTLPVQERNFCPRCGKRTADLITIHTCTPPKENT
jgi:hypothetical protein